MKKLLFFLSISMLVACHAGKKATQPSTTATQQEDPEPELKIGGLVTWDSKLLEIGKVKKGEKRDMTFAFTNTSGRELQIDIVDACHCTTVDFPRGVIPPGGRAVFPTTFDSTEKEADETIGIYVYFKQTDKNNNPLIERIEYHFELVK